MEPREEQKPNRFQIEKLEERIAPATLTVTPPGRSGSSVPSGGAPVNDAAIAANGAGGVVSVTL
jgi:hypothetical protein